MPVIANAFTSSGDHIKSNLSDKSADKRKQAGLDIGEAIKLVLRGSPQSFISIQQHEGVIEPIERLISYFVEDYCLSAFPARRKGGLIGLTSVAIACERGHIQPHVPHLVPPVLTCFADEDFEVRYHACEAFYNIAKVSREHALPFFHEIFDGLCKLYADVQEEVKAAGKCLDRLIQDIVTETPEFDYCVNVIPLLTPRIRVYNIYVKQLVLGWIELLDSVPKVDMMAHLPQFLDGLFGSLANECREVRFTAENILTELLNQIKHCPPIRMERALADAAPAVTRSCRGGEREWARLTALNWLLEFVKLLQSESEVAPSNDPSNLNSPVPELKGPRCVTGGLQLMPPGSASLIGKTTVQLELDMNDLGQRRAQQTAQRDEGAEREKKTHVRIRSDGEVRMFSHARVRSGGGKTKFFDIAQDATSPRVPRQNIFGSSGLQKLTPILLDGALYCLDDAESEIRENAEKANKALFDAVQRLRNDLPVEAIMNTLLSAMQDTVATAGFTPGQEVLTPRKESVLIACFGWARLLLDRCPQRVLLPPLCDNFFEACHAAIRRKEDEVATTALKLISQLVVMHDEFHSQDASQTSAASISLQDVASTSSSPALGQGGCFFSDVCQRIFATMAEDSKLLQDRGDLIVRELCIGVSPTRFYETAARAVSREPYGSAFARPFVRVLNQVLLTSRETKALRASLFFDATKSPRPGAHDTVPGMGEAKVPPHLMSLLQSWFHCPVSTLSLCLWLHWFELAAEVTARLARFEVTSDLNDQLNLFIDLLESPIFMRVRLQMLETQRHPALLRTVLGLVALLPKEQALRARLGIVETELLLERVPPCGTSCAQSPLTPLLQNLFVQFEDVVNQHDFRRCIL